MIVMQSPEHAEFWPCCLMFFDVRPEVEDLSAQAQATAAQHLAGVERQDLSGISCQIVQRFAVRDQRPETTGTRGRLRVCE